MADKGGKGAKGGKSALKSTVDIGDGSAKPKKGKRVQFGEDSPDNNIQRPGENVHTPTAKGGKGDKTANGTKQATGKATPSPGERKLDQELPTNSVSLMDCEAAEILQSIQYQMVVLSQDPEIKLPMSFDMGVAYAKRGGNSVKPQTLKKILEPLKKHGVSDCEICLIANICPESVEEVLSLVPPLKLKKDMLGAPLRIALGEIANLKEALANLKDLE